MPLSVNERVKLVVWVGCLCTVMWVLYAKLTDVKEPFSYGRWDFCRDVNAKLLCEEEMCKKGLTWSQPLFKSAICIEQMTLKIRPLYVSNSPIDYTYQDSEQFFSILHKLLDHNKLNQECLWKKQMNIPAWMNLAPPKKRLNGAQGAYLGN